MRHSELSPMRDHAPRLAPVRRRRPVRRSRECRSRTHELAATRHSNQSVHLDAQRGLWVLPMTHEPLARGQSRCGSRAPPEAAESAVRTPLDDFSAAVLEQRAKRRTPNDDETATGAVVPFAVDQRRCRKGYRQRTCIATKALEQRWMPKRSQFSYRLVTVFVTLVNAAQRQRSTPHDSTAIAQRCSIRHRSAARSTRGLSTAFAVGVRNDFLPALDNTWLRLDKP